MYSGLDFEETADDSTLKLCVLKFPGSKTDVTVEVALESETTAAINAHTIKNTIQACYERLSNCVLLAYEVHSASSLALIWNHRIKLMYQRTTFVLVDGKIPKSRQCKCGEWWTTTCINVGN